MADLTDKHQQLFEEASKEFQKAFNAGYELNKHEPKLLESILKTADKDNPFVSAIKAGKKQHDKDKFIEEIKQTQGRSKDKQNEK